MKFAQVLVAVCLIRGVALCGGWVSVVHKFWLEDLCCQCKVRFSGAVAVPWVDCATKLRLYHFDPPQGGAQKNRKSGFVYPILLWIENLPHIC